MQQYFVDTFFNEEKQEIKIEGQDAHHIITVMRMRPNDAVIVVIDEISYFCVITSANAQKQEVFLNVVRKENVIRELPQDITIVLGLLKSEKFDYAVQKLTELGVRTIIPWQAHHSVTKVTEKNEDKKLKRWQSIAKEAAEQSKRLAIPTITPVKSLTEILAEIDDDTHVFIGYEQLAGRRERIRLKPLKKVMFIIGPEGGFATKEIAELEKYAQVYNQRVTFVSLGSRILRAETAAIFVMGLCAAYGEELI